LLSPALLRVSSRVEGERIVPHYFTEQDEPWLRALLEVTAAQLESSLFADLRGERLVRELPKDMSPSRLATDVVGFWTQRYLTQKLESLRQAGIERLVLCIDQRRDCAEADLPSDARLIRYKTRIDPRAVLAIVAG
jgi:predicted nuclease of restriction endonuclease-like RecB superfamily